MQGGGKLDLILDFHASRILLSTIGTTELVRVWWVLIVLRCASDQLEG